MTITNARDEEHGAGLSLESSHVEMKERRNLKVLFVLAMTFMVLAGALLRGTQQYQGTSASLLEDRSLLGLFGMCGKNGKFEKVDFNTTKTGVTIAQGETKQYMTTVPKSMGGGVSAVYASGSGVSVFASRLREKPTTSAGSVVSCAGPYNPGMTTSYCTIADDVRDKPMYVWIVGDVATTFTLNIGDVNLIYSSG